MSKKIWRVDATTFEKRHVIAETAVHPDDVNATIIMDAACFPVKEAMAYMKKVETSIGDYDELESKYLAAVERMKKKAGKK